MEFRERLVIQSLATELLRNKLFFMLYPPDVGMTVDEFISENRRKLTNVKAYMGEKYGLHLSGRDKAAVMSAIRVFLDGCGRLQTEADIKDIEERKEKITKYKGWLKSR
jgi:hypothetical protein